MSSKVAAEHLQRIGADVRERCRALLPPGAGFELDEPIDLCDKVASAQSRRISAHLGASRLISTPCDKGALGRNYAQGSRWQGWTRSWNLLGAFMEPSYRLHPGAAVRRGGTASARGRHAAALARAARRRPSPAHRSPPSCRRPPLSLRVGVYSAVLADEGYQRDVVRPLDAALASHYGAKLRAVDDAVADERLGGLEREEVSCESDSADEGEGAGEGEGEEVGEGGQDGEVAEVGEAPPPLAPPPAAPPPVAPPFVAPAEVSASCQAEGAGPAQQLAPPAEAAPPPLPQKAAQAAQEAAAQEAAAQEAAAQEAMCDDTGADAAGATGNPPAFAPPSCEGGAGVSPAFAHAPAPPRDTEAGPSVAGPLPAGGGGGGVAPAPGGAELEADNSWVRRPRKAGPKRAPWERAQAAAPLGAPNGPWESVSLRLSGAGFAEALARASEPRCRTTAPRIPTQPSRGW